MNVATLINNCVDYFEYIQLGRNFGRDYERCRLKVDIAQIRLSRWGEAAAIHEDPRFATASPTDAPMLQVREIIQEIEILFQSAQKTSKRYELSAKHEDLSIGEDGDMQQANQRLRLHLRATVRQRQKQTSLMKKTTWAIYDGKQFDKLVGQITDFLDELERIWPVEVSCRQLARAEIEGLDDERALAAIQDAGASVDSVLVEAAEHKAAGINENNSSGKVNAQDQARVRVGAEFADRFQGIGMGDKNITNSADGIEAGGGSRVIIGTSYGGRSIFDD